MKNKLYFLGVLLYGILFISGCKKDDDNTDPGGGSAAIPDAVVRGTIVTPNGTVVKCGQISVGNFSTKTDDNGNFLLKVPHGTFDLVIQTGRGNVFQTEHNLTIQAGDTIVLSSQQSVLLQVGSMAFIPGNYDAIELMITALGYTASQITTTDLSAISVLTGYDALFLNCDGIATNMDSVKYQNMSTFLSMGGSIYASDWAVEYLTGDGFLRPSLINYSKSGHSVSGVEVTATCMNPLLGGFIADSSLCTAKTGSAQLVIGATVVDPDLITVLGQSTIDIDYDLGSWEKINIYDAPFVPLITHPTLGTLAVKSDYFGKNGGKIFYTTFHNEPQVVLSTDVQDILNYFILNL